MGIHLVMLTSWNFRIGTARTIRLELCLIWLIYPYGSVAIFVGVFISTSNLKKKNYLTNNQYEFIWRLWTYINLLCRNQYVAVTMDESRQIDVIYTFIPLSSNDLTSLDHGFVHYKLSNVNSYECIFCLCLQLAILSIYEQWFSTTSKRLLVIIVLHYQC